MRQSHVMAGLLLGPIAAMAHICVIHPPQRGDPLPNPVDFGEDLCYRRTPYCGGIEVPGKPSTAFLAGSPADLVFQQNLNHFHEASPGKIDVAISYDLEPSDSSWTTLFTLDEFAANDMVTQTNFTATVNIPTKTAAHAILRWRYISHNPGEVDPANNSQSIFYNCADIAVVANPDVKPGTPDVVPRLAVAQRSVDPKATGCEVASEFVALALETTVRGTVQHEIFYDAGQQSVLWHRSGPVRAEGVDENISTLSLYGASIPKQPPTTKPEYIMGLKGEGSCVLFGADPFYAWSYGPNRNQVLVREFASGGDTMQEWASPDLQHTFLVKLAPDGKTCQPVIEKHPDRTLMFTQFMPNTPVPNGIFDVPSICKKPTIGHGIH